MSEERVKIVALLTLRRVNQRGAGQFLSMYAEWLPIHLQEITVVDR